MRPERAIALGLAATGGPLVVTAALTTDCSWWHIVMFAVALAGIWWADELAWATTWRWRRRAGITREAIEEACQEHKETTP